MIVKRDEILKRHSKVMVLLGTLDGMGESIPIVFEQTQVLPVIDVEVCRV
jgi:hypothetical protein